MNGVGECVRSGFALLLAGLFGLAAEASLYVNSSGAREANVSVAVGETASVTLLNSSTTSVYEVYWEPAASEFYKVELSSATIPCATSSSDLGSTRMTIRGLKATPSAQSITVWKNSGKSDTAVTNYITVTGGGDDVPPVAADIVTNVTLRQTGPRQGLVEIGYELIRDMSSGSNQWTSITVTDRTTGKVYEAKTFTEPFSYAEGAKQMIWNAAADGVSFTSSDVVCTVKVGQCGSPLYEVVDLSGGPSAASYPVSSLADVPEGGWTEEYKTTKLVLRRIEAGSFVMGGFVGQIGTISNETPHRVTLTRPFHAGVFEVTQKQYELVMGTNQSAYVGASRPVERVSYADVRGSEQGACWPASTSVDETSFLGRLRTKTGLDFDLPTEAQWEYACRAGTTTALNSGKELTDVSEDPNLGEVGRYSGNQSDGRGGYSSGHTTVGSYLPNAWGLYDMHGNVWEYCLDWYVVSLTDATDPVGGTSGSYRIERGGSWSREAVACTSSHRGWVGASDASTDRRGFRLARTLFDEAFGSMTSPSVSLDLSSGPATFVTKEVVSDPQSSDATVEITVQAEPTLRPQAPKVLFFGTRCWSHGLTGATVRKSLNAIKGKADVDWYLFGNYADNPDEFGLHSSGSLFCGGADVSADTIPDSAFTNSLHYALRPFIHWFDQVLTAKAYDYIVIETDGSRLANEYGGTGSARDGARDADLEARVAQLLLPYYAQSNVIWVLDNGFDYYHGNKNNWYFQAVEQNPSLGLSTEIFQYGSLCDGEQGRPYRVNNTLMKNTAESGQYVHRLTDEQWQGLLAIFDPQLYLDIQNGALPYFGEDGIITNATYFSDTSHEKTATGDLYAGRPYFNQMWYDDADRLAERLTLAIEVQDVPVPYRVTIDDRIKDGLDVTSVAVSVVTNDQREGPWFDLLTTNLLEAAGSADASLGVRSSLSFDASTNGVSVSLDNLSFDAWIRLRIGVTDGGSFRTEEGARLNAITGLWEKDPNDGAVVVSRVDADGTRSGCQATTSIPWAFEVATPPEEVSAAVAHIDGVLPEEPTEADDIVLCGRAEGESVAAYVWRAAKKRADGSWGNVSELSRSETAVVSLSAGEWKIEFLVQDAEGRWSEADEIELSVAETVRQPDLALYRSDIRFLDADGNRIRRLAADTDVTVALTVRNLGEAPMTGPFHVYLCEGVLSETEISGLKANDTNILACVTCDGVPSGESVACSMPWAVGRNAAGTDLGYSDGARSYTFVVKPADAEAESRTDNNFVSAMMLVGEPLIAYELEMDVNAPSTCVGGARYSVCGQAWYDWLGKRFHAFGTDVALSLGDKVVDTTFTRSPDGDFRLAFRAPTIPGQYTLTVKVSDGFSVDTVTRTFVVPEPQERESGPVPEPKPRPNLLIRSFETTGSGVYRHGSSQDVAHLNGEVGVRAYIVNGGDLPVSNSFRIVMTACESKDSASPVTLGKLEVEGGLDVGEGVAMEVEPCCLATDHETTWKLKVVADDCDEVAESSEADNTAARSLIVLKDRPDLRCDFPTSSVSKPVVGDEVTVYGRVYNDGQAQTDDAFMVRLYVDDVMVEEWAIPPPLDVGAGVPVSYVYDSTGIAPGTHTFRFTADVGHDVEENGENNNSSARGLYFFPPYSVVYPYALTASPYPAAGQPCVLTASVRNDGGVAYAGGTAAFCIGDPLDGSIGTGTVGRIAAKGGTTTSTCAWTPSGGGKIPVTVEVEGRTYTTMFNLDVPPPDLRVTSEDLSLVPEEPAAGDEVRFRAQVHNVSRTASATNVTVTFAVTEDDVYEALTTIVVPYLAPKGTVTVDADVPYRATTGLHALKVGVLDGSGKDEDLSDNEATRSFAVDGPVAEVASAVLQGVVGEPVDLSCRTVNRISAWEWKIVERPEGSVAEVEDADRAQARFVPDVAGIYRFSVVVTRDGVESAPAEVELIADRAVVPIDLGLSVVVLSSGDFVYDGSEKRPSAFVTFEGETVNSSGYTVQYSAN